MSDLIGLMGRRFGRLVVIGKAPSKGKGALWRVRCDCGNERTGQSYWLRNGAQSCGCLASAQTIERSTKHGLVGTPEYRSWLSMMHRCYREANHNFDSYGGRGVSVCKRWHNVTKFLEDIGERPPGTSVDRIDIDGNYEPGNCRWATPSEQANNRRNSRFITYQGKTQTIAQWSAEIGVSDRLLRSRFERGWPLEDAFTKPGQRSIQGST